MIVYLAEKNRTTGSKYYRQAKLTIVLNGKKLRNFRVPRIVGITFGFRSLQWHKSVKCC